ncbi:hypothetical protein CCP4SC76_2330003 [Gammaproteobacteria bacterium]
MPELQRPLVGALLSDWPLDEPQLPMVMSFGAEQLALDPPLLPAHDQYHGP